MDPIDPIKAFAAGWTLGETYADLGSDAVTKTIKVVADKLDVRSDELGELIVASGRLVGEILGAKKPLAPRSDRLGGF